MLAKCPSQESGNANWDLLKQPQRRLMSSADGNPASSTVQISHCAMQRNVTLDQHRMQRSTAVLLNTLLTKPWLGLL